MRGKQPRENGEEQQGRHSLGMGTIKNTVIPSFYFSLANLYTFLDSLCKHLLYGKFSCSGPKKERCQLALPIKGSPSS